MIFGSTPENLTVGFVSWWSLLRSRYSGTLEKWDYGVVGIPKYFNIICFRDIVNSPNPDGSETVVIGIKMVARVPKRGLIVGCFSRPTLHHDVFVAETVSLVHEYGLLV